MLVDRSGLLPDREPMRAVGVAATEHDGRARVLVAGYGEPNRLFRGTDAGLIDEIAALRRATARGTDRYGEAAPVADPDAHAVGVAAADADGDGIEELYVHNVGSFARSVIDPTAPPGASGGPGQPEPDRLLDPYGDTAQGGAAGGDSGDTADRAPDHATDHTTDYTPNHATDHTAGDPGGWLDLLDDPRNRAAGNPTVGRGVAPLDRTGDGTYAFLVTGYAVPARLQSVDGGSVRDRAPDLGLDFLGGGQAAVAGPLSAQPVRSSTDPTNPLAGAGPRMDLFLGMERGPNLLLRNDGGGFTDFAGETGVSDAHGDTRAAAPIDLGGRLGLAVGTDDGRNRVVALPDEHVGSEDVTPDGFAAPGPVRSVVAADLDNDGRQELFVTCQGAPNRLFERTGEWDHPGGWERREPGDAAAPDAASTGAVAADLDGDGRLELLVARGGPEPEPLAVYAAEADGDWLRVRPRTRHGAPARGALVTVVLDSGRECRRVVGAGGGYCSGGEPVAHVGLGAAPPQSVTVHWPDGETTARRTDVAANRTLDVPFPG